jgi:hypothetical protein
MDLTAIRSRVLAARDKRQADAFDYDAEPAILALRKVFSKGFDSGVSASAKDNAYFREEFGVATDSIIQHLKRMRQFADSNPGTSGLSRARGFHGSLADAVARYVAMLGYIVASGTAAKRDEKI